MAGYNGSIFTVFLTCALPIIVAGQIVSENGPAASAGLSGISISGVLPTLSGKDYIPITSSNIVTILQPQPLQGTFQFLATGVLLSPTEVLTSAHAVTGKDRRELVVYQPGTTTALVTDVTIHREYQSHVPADDLAILKTDAPLVFEKNPPKAVPLPCVIGLHSRGNQVLEPFVIPVVAANSGDGYLPQSSTTFLFHGNSGSPLYIPGEDGLPILTGIFSSKEYSLDRSTQTRYFFAKVEDSISRTEFIESPPNKSLTFNALVPISDPGDVALPLDEGNCYNPKKHLYAVTIINRSMEPLSISLGEDSPEPVSAIKWPMQALEKRSYSTGMSQKVQLAPNDCLSLIVKSPGTDSYVVLVVFKE